MPKLLLVIPTLDQSGAEKQFRILAERLSQKGMEVRVVSLNRGGHYETELTEAGITVDVLNKRWRFDPFTISQLRKIISQWQPDVVLSGLFAANTAVRLATLAMPSRPVIMISERCVDVWKAGWQLWLDKKLAKYTDRLIANSQSVAEFYAKLGIPQEKISVIPNGVTPPPLPQFDRQQLCSELNLPADAKLVAYVGRLAKQKRLSDLLWAAQLLRQSNPHVYFLVIGDGPEREKLELLAGDLEVSQHVRFLGHRADASSLFNLVDVFWLASEFEGMSNSLMEAMSCGKPVVVSNIPPNRELVQHGREGYLIDLKDSAGYSQFAQKILEDPQLSEQLGHAGQQRMLENFSVDLMVERFFEQIQADLK